MTQTLTMSEIGQVLRWGLCHLAKEVVRLVFLSPSLYVVYGIEW